MAGDISLAALRWFRIPSQRVWKFTTERGMSRRGAALGQPGAVTGATAGNFWGAGVSLGMGLHPTGIAPGNNGAWYEMTGVTASETPSP